jgi:hypothetical protein
VPLVFPAKCGVSSFLRYLLSPAKRGSATGVPVQSQEWDFSRYRRNWLTENLFWSFSCPHWSQLSVDGNDAKIVEDSSAFHVTRFLLRLPCKRDRFPWCRRIGRHGGMRLQMLREGSRSVGGGYTGLTRFERERSAHRWQFYFKRCSGHRFKVCKRLGPLST